MQNDVVIVSMNDDWEGLYVDGALITQGHTVSIDDILDAFGLTIDSRYADDSWSEDRGDLPDDLADVVCV